MKTTTLDIICVGELLIDLIGHEVNTSINQTKDFHRFLGGSPTNVAVNAARLGLQSLLVASCGQDGFGDYALRKLKANQVNTSVIRRLEHTPTSVIVVSKSTDTPDFIPYRQADGEIELDQLPDALLESARIFHTTCFALSKQPARDTILDRAKRAAALGLQLSIDLNFSERIWPNREEAMTVIQAYLSNNPLVKVSEDDCYRLFAAFKSEDYIFDFFHDFGAKTVCLTKGKKGVVLSDTEEGLITQKALPLAAIKDTTGAGDAFWTGFLYAGLQGFGWEQRLTVAQRLAAIKLQNVGRLPEDIDIKQLLA